MTRTIMAIATAFLFVITVFASAADAGYCGGRGYGGPCGVGPSFGASTKSYGAKRYYARAIARTKAKARARSIAAAKAKAKARAVAAARAKAKAKARAAAKAAAAEDVELAEEIRDENSTISTASLDKSESTDTEETPTEEPKVNKNVGCKKFFPAVGMTLTVPCE